MIRIGNPPEQVIQVCPVCLSKSLKVQPSFLAFIAPTTYYCTICEYKGPIYAEIPIQDYNSLARINETENISSQVEAEL